MIYIELQRLPQNFNLAFGHKKSKSKNLPKFEFKKKKFSRLSPYNESHTPKDPSYQQNTRSEVVTATAGRDFGCMNSRRHEFFLCPSSQKKRRNHFETSAVLHRRRPIHSCLNFEHMRNWWSISVALRANWHTAGKCTQNNCEIALPRSCGARVLVKCSQTYQDLD